MAIPFCWRAVSELEALGQRGKGLFLPLSTRRAGLLLPVVDFMAALPHALSMRFDTALPIDAVLDALTSALKTTPNAVLVAPPGAGKTTRVPLALLEAPWRKGGKILVLEPRRIAARGAAARMAQTLGEAVGETIGLRARMVSKVSARTQVEVITEGVFTRMILDDPALDGIAAVLFDEFHERSLDADFGLALALDAQAGLRDDLRLLVMSATLDGARVAKLLGDQTPVIESEGRAFPIETRHVPRDPLKRIEEQMADAVLRALRAETGSMLVFLPGQGEIRRVEQILHGKSLPDDCDLAPLYGAMEMREQDLAIKPALPDRRKVVLATAIAETSLTIEGVRIVIDCGLARVPRYEPDMGVTRLETVRISRASADQRRGRAGRTEPGIAYRLWEEAATQSLPAFGEPEIRAADLSGLVLDCAEWGVADVMHLRWLDPPPLPAIKEAREELITLGALEGGLITPLGRKMRALPLPPRLARMVIEAGRKGAGALAADIAAILVERGMGGDSVDLAQRLAQWRRDRSSRAEDMRRLAQGWAKQAGSAKHDLHDISPAALLALAYPDRIAMQRSAPGHYVLANGRGAGVDPSDPLARNPMLVVAELTGKAASARIMLAAALSEDDLHAVAGHRLVMQSEVSFDAEARALRARSVKRLGAIQLKSETRPVGKGPESARILAEGVARLGVSSLPFTKHQSQWRDRIGFLRAAEGSAWPDLSDGALVATIHDWLTPFLEGLTSLSAIGPDVLGSALSSLLPYPLQRRLEDEAPTHFEAPTGHHHPIDYEGEGAPILAIRVQELYGLEKHPAIVGGKLPLTLHLLSPAHRPIQITRDLPGFWKGSWASVKADMKGRYPRHLWPDDPARAVPTARAKPRGT
jgi:ATP-dependent helicase HrpB